MTIPEVPRFEDFAFDLLEHPTGNRICPLDTSLLEGLEVHVLPGVTTDRLKSAFFSISDTSLAAGYLDPTVRQYLRIMPYGDTSRIMYGFIANIQKHYGGTEEDGATYNIIDVEVIGTEALLDSRECYIYSGGEALAIEVDNVYPDDFAKYMVRHTMVAGTCTNDVDGNSRDWTWGTLSVEADTSECPDQVDLSVGDGFVGQAIQSLSDKYAFAFELRPTFAAGAVTFTFATACPMGADRSEDNTDSNPPVIINDFIEAMIPEATYHRTLYPMVNALHGRGYDEVEIDAASIASWGRWEGSSNSTGIAKIQTELAHLLDREGCTFTFSARGTGGAYKWLENYFAGDTITFSNVRLGVAARDETIAELTLRFPDGELEIEIRWGDKTPTYSDDNKDENLAPARGGGSDPMLPDLWIQYWERVSGALRPVAHGDDIVALTSGDATSITLDASTGDAILTGDLKIQTALKGIYGSVNTNKFAFIANGTKFVPRQMTLADLDAATHALLGPYHSDTLTRTCEYGALIIGNSDLAWTRLSIGTADKVLQSNGTTASWQTLTMSDLSDGHAAVTLSALLASNLLSLTGQEIGLDTQTANYIFAGPTAGGAAAPAFRAMALADLYDHRHAVNGNTGSGTASGTTSTYTPAGNATVVKDSTGTSTALYFWAATVSDGSDAAWRYAYTRTAGHDHTFSSAHTHPVAITSGAPAAP